jgi:hypothetical protein
VTTATQDQKINMHPTVNRHVFPTDWLGTVRSAQLLVVCYILATSSSFTSSQFRTTPRCISHLDHCSRPSSELLSFYSEAIINDTATELNCRIALLVFRNPKPERTDMALSPWRRTGRCSWSRHSRRIPVSATIWARLTSQPQFCHASIGQKF